jgi:hypothetical protein
MSGIGFVAEGIANSKYLNTVMRVRDAKDGSRLKSASIVSHELGYVPPQGFLYELSNLKPTRRL